MNHPMPHARIQHYVSKSEESLNQILFKHFKVKDPEHLYKLGSIYLNKKRVFADQIIKPNDYLRLHLESRRFKVDYDWKKIIVISNPDFVVVNKPRGLPVHATVDNHTENLLYQLREYLKTDVYITHRLDQTTSGLMVYAKTLEFQKAFNNALKDRAITKHYRTYVQKNIQPGHYTHYMSPDPRCPKEMSLEAKEGWYKCELEILTCTPKEDVFQLRINLLSGRSHQIRAQLMAMNNPIIGDKMYQSKESQKKYFLESCHLEFNVAGSNTVASLSPVSNDSESV
jgi:23S rRNA pseudouridine1911/1915/1917 synthase